MSELPASGATIASTPRLKRRSFLILNEVGAIDIPVNNVWGCERMVEDSNFTWPKRPRMGRGLSLPRRDSKTNQALNTCVRACLQLSPCLECDDG
jgi:hypothetical protein